MSDYERIRQILDNRFVISADYFYNNGKIRTIEIGCDVGMDFDTETGKLISIYSLNQE